MSSDYNMDGFWRPFPSHGLCLKKQTNKQDVTSDLRKSKMIGQTLTDLKDIPKIIVLAYNSVLIFSFSV